MEHKGTQHLETERLILRRFTLEDAEAMYENWANDDEVTKFISWHTHQNIDVTRSVLGDWVSHYPDDDFYQWAIVPKEGDGRPVGSIGAVKVFDKISAVQIGYCIGRKWWHRGITSEALKALIVFFFDEVGVERIEAIHDTRNPNSGGVMEKCGMKHEGTLRRAFKGNSGIGDVKIYSILKSDL
ncbi:MAG: GNAT family N-acetyltransferase [Ruminococcus sp.]|uniref:GNAT family N-acetyltransferase n=1 Tax=Ruminococcus sp. TaxID=41978 RepID=UPI0025E92436|nr:GNAT family N-acetyltransferase [Ruminococcus sp.]MBR5681661.1 GNAT family N-acetyltransferase [Ruminococcus sp.]